MRTAERHSAAVSSIADEFLTTRDRSLRGPMIRREIENRRSPVTNSFPVNKQRIGEGFPQMKIILR
jgi:hypothetical protein